MTFPADQIVSTLTMWLFPFVRLAAAVTTSPIFGNRSIPVRVKILIPIALAVAIVPVLPPGPRVDPVSATGFLIVAREVLIGLSFGFALRLAFLAAELTGQYIAHLMGLGFAALIDPNSGANIPMLSQFYILVATLVFLGIDGHLLTVSVLAESFTVIPIGGPTLDLGALSVLATGAGWVFGAALTLAFPAIVTLLVVNFGFGIISRAAPQLHVIVIGFPLTLLFGFVVVWLTFGTVATELDVVFLRAFDAATTVLNTFAGKP